MAATQNMTKFDRSLYRNGNRAKGLCYGQIEENQVWFTRDGMVEAQCKLDPTWFSDVQVAPLTVGVPNTAAAGQPSNGTPIVAQSGAFLMIDKAKYLATVPTTAGETAKLIMGINYSTERLYDDFAKGRRNFFLTTQDWLPRIGFLDKGMRFTTNTVQWSQEYVPSQTFNDGTTSAVANFSGYTASTDSYKVFNGIKDLISKGETIYAAVLDGSDGELVIGVDPANDAILGGVLCQVVAAYDNADRTCSFMFNVLSA